MNIKKKVIASFDKLYAIAVIMQNNRPISYLAATEGEGKCVAVNTKTGAPKTLWEQPGGTMTICQLNNSGDFLAVQKFLPVFAAENAEIVYGKRLQDGNYDIKKCIDLPYIHRFDILEIDGGKMFVGATLCGGKESQQDWSKPGRVYVGEIPENPENGIRLKVILEGITKNHGFCTTYYNGEKVVLVSGSEGLFRITPPSKCDGLWKTDKIFNREISDMAVVDFDNDGVDEIAVIEGFHGNQLTVNKLQNGEWVKIYELNISFGHAVWGGKLLGKNRLIVGYRRDKKELLCITKEEKGVETILLGNGGPSQINVIPSEDQAIIYSADREAGEAVLYTVSQ